MKRSISVLTAFILGAVLILAVSCESKEAKEARLAAEALAAAEKAAAEAAAAAEKEAAEALKALIAALEAGEGGAFVAAMEKIKEESRPAAIQGLSPVAIAASFKTGANFGDYAPALYGALGNALQTATPELFQALNAQASPGGDFAYDLNKAGNGIIIKQYTGKNPVLIIPAEIEGYPVVQVGMDGEWDYESKVASSLYLTAVVIPENVKRIGNQAFKEQRYLTSVTLPDGLETIGGFYYYTRGSGGAFSGCSSLKSIRIPDTVKSLEINAFSSCSALTDTNIPAGIQQIHPFVFSGCRELYNLTIPASVTAVRWPNTGFDSPDAFGSCGKLPLATRQRLKDLGYKGGF